MDTIKRGAYTRSIDGSNYTLEAYASTGNIDRYNEIILPAAYAKTIKSYLKDNPVILWGHEHSELPVAKTIEARVDDVGLWVKLQFAVKEYEFAEQVWKLYEGGYLNAFSVGFRPLKYLEPNEAGNDTGVRVYTLVELYEISSVTVPANRESLVLASADARRWQAYKEAKASLFGNDIRGLYFEDAVIKKVLNKPLNQEAITLDGGDIPLHKSETLLNQAQMDGLKAMLAAPSEDINTEEETMKKNTVVPEQAVEETVAAAVEDTAEDLAADAVVENAETKDEDDVVEDAVDNRAKVTIKVYSEGELIREYDADADIVQTAGSIELDIKAGAVLSKANKGKLAQIKALADEILASAEPNEDAAADTEVKEAEGITAEVGEIIELKGADIKEALREVLIESGILPAVEADADDVKSDDNKDVINDDSTVAKKVDETIPDTKPERKGIVTSKSVFAEADKAAETVEPSDVELSTARKERLAQAFRAWGSAGVVKSGK